MSTEADLTRIAVLAVDDVEDNLDLLEEMLGGEVWSFIRAESGEEAIRLATEHHPDVVLLDLMMPRMNGLSVLRAFRETTALCQMATILQTAFANPDAVLAAKRLGCKHVLTKPISRERLLAEIRGCLGACRGRTLPAEDSAEPEREPTPSRDLTRALGDARRLLEVDDTAQVADQIETTDCLRNLITADSLIGQKLIKVANSPAYSARYPVRNVTEAIVRVGIRETKELIRKAATDPPDRQSSSRTLKALELLESLALLFPDRTATSEGMLALLNDLDRASDPAVSASCTETHGKQTPQAPAQAGSPA